MVGINTEGELDFLFDMHDSAQQLREADEELGECEAKANSLYRLILLLPGLVKDKLDDTLDEEILSQLEPIRITQPFEMCFAFLSLLDHNSDIVWAYNAAYVIMFVVCHELPWGESECFDRDWGMGIDRGEEFVEMSLDIVSCFRRSGAIRSISQRKRQRLHSPLRWSFRLTRLKICCQKQDILLRTATSSISLSSFLSKRASMIFLQSTKLCLSLTKSC